MILDFFEAYLEGKIVAVVRPYVRIPQDIAAKTLLLQLPERRVGERAPGSMSQELVKGAK